MSKEIHLQNIVKQNAQIRDDLINNFVSVLDSGRYVSGPGVEKFEQEFAADHWNLLAAKGANVQRPLWASTGVKDPAYDDTRYVLELVAPNTVNTMPQSTLDAVIDHGVFKGNTIAGKYEEARIVFTQLAELGISIDKVTADLESDGVKKFADAWTELLASVKGAMA
jgi:transaldolase